MSQHCRMFASVLLSAGMLTRTQGQGQRTGSRNEIKDFWLSRHVSCSKHK